MYGWFNDQKPHILEIIERAYETNKSLAWLYLHGIADEAGTTTDVFYKTFQERWVWRSLSGQGWRIFESDIAQGVPTNVALELMIKRMSGSAFRHTYNGSRDTIMRTVQKSNTMVGYQRVSMTGWPCYFCAMLISRGAVYKRNMGRFKAHDSDKCTAEPRFRNELLNKPDAQVKKFSDIWGASGAKHSGMDAINAFRDAYNAEKSK
nr:hypothetical protein GCM10025732_48230 [Glycomyces mayteni]